MVKMKNLIIMADGQGSLFTAIAKACKTQQLKARILALITSNPKAEVLEKAKNYQIPFLVFDLKSYSSFLEWDKALGAYLENLKPDYIVLAGFLKKIGEKTLKKFPRCIVNIHPALLPLYGGKGMYGSTVHKEVIKAGDKITGSTVHLVFEDYDAGPILAQKTVPVLTTDTASSLEKKVKKMEQTFYISVLQKIFKGDYSDAK